jgi:glycosyltransferase involved in cell wall biosynthesis
MANQIRVLHVVGSMVSGGVETWLLQVLRHIDRDRFHLDILVHTDQPGDYDDEVRKLDSEIFPCVEPKRPFLYSKKFATIVNRDGKYDVVHSHVDRFSGYVMRLAAKNEIPVRITHSHLDASSSNAKAGIRRRGYLRVMGNWINRYSTIGLAASEPAGRALFERKWGADPRLRTLYCGIETAPFQGVARRRELRREFRIPDDSFVVGHVGNFRPQKNHEFIVEIARDLLNREPASYFLLIGDGPLRPMIEAKVSSIGLSDRVIFAGRRADVSQLLNGAIDVFLFPSLFEGLPLSLLEAQAAGLRSVVSAEITTEADVVPSLIDRLPVSMPAAEWACAVLAARSASNVSRSVALKQFESSPFDIRQSVASLEAIYASD